MARLPRYAMPDQPQHIIQRGNNRSSIYVDRADYEHFLDELRNVCEQHACAVHAYALMTNHFHLLFTAPDATVTGKAMQSLGRRYVGYFNRRHRRTGTLWEGRYRSVPIDSERYLFTCYRYIEQNPVRAGLAADPAHYAWSSYRANAIGSVDPLVTPHARFLALAPDTAGRLAAYRAICAVPFDSPTLHHVRSAIRGSWALGDAGFRTKITTATGRRAAPLRRPVGDRVAPAMESDPLRALGV